VLRGVIVPCNNCHVVWVKNCHSTPRPLHGGLSDELSVCLLVLATCNLTQLHLVVLVSEHPSSWSLDRR
jgi:hypothetical protein